MELLASQRSELSQNAPKVSQSLWRSVTEFLNDKLSQTLISAQLDIRYKITAVRQFSFLLLISHWYTVIIVYSRGVSYFNFNLPKQEFLSPRSFNVCWQNSIRTTHRFSSTTHISSLCCALSIKIHNQNISVSRSAFMHSFLATNLT